MRRIASFALTGLLILGVFVWAFDTPDATGPGAGESMPEIGRPYTGPTLTAALETVVPFAESVGTVQAQEQAVVASELLAGIRAVHVAAGDTVQAGQLVIELDDREERTRVQQAKETMRSAAASLEEAERDVQRFTDLHAQQAATKRDLDQAGTRRAVAAAEMARATQALREAEVNLSLTKVHAPVSGVVVDKLVDAGDLASPGKPLLSIYNPSLLRLEVDVRTALLQRIHLGDNVSVRIDDTNATVTGRIGEIVPSANVASRSVRVKVDLPPVPGLYVGMFGRLQIPLDPREQLMIARAAVRQVGQLTMVDTVRDGRAHRRLVTLGDTIEDRVHVLSGLEPGERIAAP